MKGIVFTEFLEMLEEQHSMELVDEVLEGVELASGGVFTSVGTYAPAEMVALVVAAAGRIGQTPAELLRRFGHHLFASFRRQFPVFFVDATSALEFLPLVQSYVHLEVQKLYPDAELPTFEVIEQAPGTLTLVYRSGRNLPDLAQGLIEAAIQHFGAPVELERAACPEDPAGTVFRLVPAQAA